MNERVTVLKQFIADDPKDIFSKYALALEYHKAGNSAAAIEILEDIKTRQPDYLATYYQLGKLYESVGRAEEAAKIYESGLVIAQQNHNSKTYAELKSALEELE